MKNSWKSNPYWRLISNSQVYKNIAYLLLSFPTGLMYFLLIVIGSSLGFGLAVIGVGLLILWGTFILTQLGANLERWLANNLLSANIPERTSSITSIRTMGDGNSWLAILFLFLKLPLGIVSFVLTMTVIPTVFALIFAPFLYSTEAMTFGFRVVDTLWEAILASAFGVLLLPVALLFLAKIASAWRGLATRLLDVSLTQQKAKNGYYDDSAMDRLTEDLEDGEVAYYDDSSGKGVLTG